MTVISTSPPRSRRTRRLLVLILGALTATTLWAATPSRPATTTTKPTTSTKPATTSMPASTSTNPSTSTRPATSAPRLFQADEILAKFPANANRVPKNTRITVEGRVVDVRKITTNGITIPHVILVGIKQPDEDPGHFTCIMEHPDAAAADLKSGKIIDITGSISTVDPAISKIEMTKCSGIVETPEKFAYNFSDHWRGQPENNPVTQIELTFKPNLSVAAVFTIKGETVRLAGLVAPNPKEPTKFTMRLEKTDGPVELELLEHNDLLYVPSILPLLSMEGSTRVALQRIDGTAQPLDFKVTENLMNQWLNANITVAQPTTFIAAVKQAIDVARPTQAGYTFAVGAAVTRSRKATELDVINGRLYVFEYSDAEYRVSGLQPSSWRTHSLPVSLPAMVPEVKIESLVLENQNRVDPTKEIKGKITMRALRIVPGPYSLVIQHVHSTSEVFLDIHPGLDPETFEFTIPPFIEPKNAAAEKAMYANPNPLATFFSINRMDSDVGSSRVSESIGMLLDLVP